LAPLSVQHISVYPSQHAEPHAHDEPLHRHTAAYALVGRSTNVLGAATSAVPVIALRTRNPRRSVRDASIPEMRSTSRVLTRSPSRS
jgi:hypothetical protein